MKGVRKVDDQYLVEVEIDSSFDLDGAVEDVISRLQTACRGYINCKLDVNYNYDYTEYTLTGDRFATNEEITKYEAKRVKEKERAVKEKKEKEEKRKAKDLAALERAREVFPEEFK